MIGSISPFSNMTTIVSLIPSIVQLNGFDTNYFKHRNTEGDLAFVQRVTKRYYITHSINVSNFLLACNRIFSGSPSSFSPDFTTMLEESNPSDWMVFYRPKKFLQEELDKFHRFYSDHQHVKKRSARSQSSSSPVWVYAMTHKPSGRRFHMTMDKPCNHEELTGHFMRHWKNNNTDSLDRGMIHLGSYFKAMHHFQEATKSLVLGKLEDFEFSTLENFQGVDRKTARYATTHTNRLDTIRYFQGIYNALRAGNARTVREAQGFDSLAVG